MSTTTHPGWSNAAGILSSMLACFLDVVFFWHLVRPAVPRHPNDPPLYPERKEGTRPSGMAID